MRQTPDRLREIASHLKDKMNLRSLIVTLAAIVVFTTTYMLILPAFTLDSQSAAEQGGIDVPAVETTAEDTSDSTEASVVDENAAANDADANAEQAEASGGTKADQSAEKADAKAKDPDESAAKVKDADQEKSDVKLLTGKKTITARQGKGDDFAVSAVVSTDAKVPADVTITATELGKNTDGFDYDQYKDDALAALKKDSSDVKSIKSIKFYDISLESDSQDKSVEPSAPVSVKISYDDGMKVSDADNIRIVHFAEQKNGTEKAQVLDANKNNVETTTAANGSKVTEASFDTDGFSKYAVVEVETIEKTVITADGQTYKVSVEYGKDANIPEGSVLEVKEIEKGSEKYNDYLVESREAMGFDDEVETTLARFFDITIKNGNSKVEPEAPVKVQITYEDGTSVNQDDTFGIVHFAEQGTEVIKEINLSNDGTELTYEQSSFSVVGTVAGTFSGNNWPDTPAGDDYALIVYSGTGGPYYAVDSNGGLVAVDYDSETGIVTFPENAVSSAEGMSEYKWAYYVSGGNHRLTSVAKPNNKIYPEQREGGSALSNSTNSPGANQGYIYRGNNNNRYCVAINSAGTNLISSHVSYYYGYTYPSNAAHFMFVNNLEDVTGGYGTASSIILTGNSKTLRMADVTTEDGELIDFEGFTWHSTNTSVATVTTDPDTDAPIATGISPGTTKIIGTRLNEDGETDEVIWTVTVKDKTSNSIVFLHQPQDNSNFANQDNIRPHDGYGNTEPTNYVKFVVALADEDGNIRLYDGKPNVELPAGSIVPERYEFELDSRGVFAIEEDTLSGISVPGYSYAGTYAYFGWYNNTDLENMAVVSEFKNLGQVSSRYPNYYSVLGFKTSRGNPQYQDYSQTAFGDRGYGYYAYNPTGVLMIVLQPVSEDIGYRTSYHNDYVPGGTARTNIVDTTRAKMTRGEWIPDEYRWDWYGETIMTQKTGADLTSPADGYEFVGWFDSVDAEGNGTGNQIVGQTEDGYYYAMKDGEKIVIRQNNDIYAKWQLVRGTLTIKKEIEGNLTAGELAQLEEKLSFTVTDVNTSEIVRTVDGSDMTWSGKTGQYDVTGLSAATTYTVAESNADLDGYEVETTVTYPGGGSSAKVSKTGAVTVNVKNKYTKQITDISIKKVDEKTSAALNNAKFRLLDENEENAKHYVNGEWVNVGTLEDGSYYITVSGDSGLPIEGLPFGTYTLIETSAPEGYIISENSISFEVAKDTSGNTIITTDAPNASVDESNKTQLIVTNKPGETLPSTGGIGTTIFYILGSLLVVGCGIVLISRKRMGSDK